MALGQTSTYQLADDGQWLASKSPEPGTDEATIARTRQLLADGKAGAGAVLDIQQLA